jgi:hypothetical protein
MSLREWFRKEWDVVFGGIRYDIYKWGALLVAAAIPTSAIVALSKAPALPQWVTPTSVFVLLVVLFLLLRSRLSSTGSPVVRPRSKKSSKSILKAELHTIVFHHKRLRISNDVFVLLQVSIVNHGQDELVIARCDLEAWAGENNAFFDLVDIPRKWAIRRFEIGEFPKEESIQPNPENPLRKGIPNIYWFNFKMRTLGHSLPPNNAMYVMTITDGLGVVHDAGSWGPAFFEEDVVLLADYDASAA